MEWIWRVALWTTLTVVSSATLAAESVSPAGQATGPPRQTSAMNAPAPAPPHVSAIHPAQTEETLTPAALRSELDASELRLRQVIHDSRPTSWLEKLWPALLGFVGVIVGGCINIWLHGKQRVATERASRASAAFDAQTQIIEYRSRQAHEFYYPLLLSLQRSSGVRRQICDHLHAKKPARFRFHKEADGQEHLFIYDPSKEEPVRFRLIEAMHELAKGHSETLPMVNEIVAIGEQMSALIHDKGGLVLSSNADLTDSLGRYLAHFSILREVARKAENPSLLEGISYNVLYPNELDGQLQSDIIFLQKSIEAWSVFSAKLWSQAMPDNPMPALTPQMQSAAGVSSSSAAIE